jgi:hypothetical protein
MHLKRSKKPFMVILYASNMVPSREADVSIRSVECLNGKMHSLFRRPAKFTKVRSIKRYMQHFQRGPGFLLYCTIPYIPLVFQAVQI